MQLGKGRAQRNVEDRWNKSVAWGTYRWPRSSEDDRAGQHGGDGDSDGEGRREKYNLPREISQTRGSPYGSFGVLCPKSW